MAVAVKRLAQANEQVDLKSPGATIPYIAFRSNDEAAVRAAVNAGSDAYYYDLPKTSIQLKEQGGGVWLADVVYGVLTGFGESGQIPDQSNATTTGAAPPGTTPTVPGDDDPLDSSYSFSVTGETRHVTQALSWKDGDGNTHSGTTRYGRGNIIAPDFEGTIGANKGGKPDGCDILVGKLEFSMTKQIPTISLNYVKKLRDLVGTVNSGIFYGRAAGEVLFLGASGQISTTASAGGWTVTFNFAESKNQTAATDPDLIIVPDSAPGANDGLTVTEKDGWDYLWVYYEPAVSESFLGQRPVAAFVERVYPRTDYSLLGIGTTNA